MLKNLLFSLMKIIEGLVKIRITGFIALAALLAISLISHYLWKQ